GAPAALAHPRTFREVDGVARPRRTVPRQQRHQAAADDLLRCRDAGQVEDGGGEDRKSTRLNSSHVSSSYAVFCLKKKTSAFFTISWYWWSNLPMIACLAESSAVMLSDPACRATRMRAGISRISTHAL